MKKIYLILLFLFLLIGKASFAQYVIHIAGDDSCGFSGDGDPALYASDNQTSGICVDKTGNLFFADYNSSVGRVRKITASTGIINTVAGGGSATGDNIPATTASLFTTYPIGGVCMDTSGNLIIADGKSKIRKVNLYSGIITTVAGNAALGYSGDGGPASAAKLAEPYDVAVDTANNIYIADRSNNVIRKVTAVNGIITTVAGMNLVGSFSGDGGAATAARLNLPRGLYVDKNANIYIADNGNSRVRMVSAATGIINTIAGTGASSDIGEGVPATAGGVTSPLRVTMDKTGNIYISDGAHFIRRVDASTHIITTYAGTGFVGGGVLDSAGDGGPATSAGMYPYGMCFDTCGNLFFADNHCRIRAVVPELPTSGVVCHFLVDAVQQVAAPTTRRWQVFPNPATIGLTVNNPGGNFVITDMLGRTMLKGALIPGTQGIDISPLMPGTYIFTGYKDDASEYNSVFVKE